MDIEFDYEEIKELIDRLGTPISCFNYSIDEELASLVRKLRLAIKTSLSNKTVVSLSEKERKMLIDNSTVLVDWDGIHTTQKHLSALRKLADFCKKGETL